MLKTGDIVHFERTFTKRDVELFTALSMDEGNHHTKPDEFGRVVVQGLLTASMPTKIGGEYNVLARTMNFEFFRPVFTEDTIQCEVKIEKAEPDHANRIALLASFLCTNQLQKKVMSGSFTGVILAE